MGIVGIVVVVALLYFFSFDRQNIDYKSILYLFGTEIIILFFMLRTAVGDWLLKGLSGSLNIITVSSKKGVNFVFEDLKNPQATSQFFWTFYCR
ncbi:hypothetical protein DS832_02145 [Bombilactobacillus bombi]|uniref:Concentrative nucleoside transporter N-terminal domain-containing protein n=1 Tax=Bombilactobacillus bombi TaxID=1303590 RepID=A0A3R6VHK8_9LACO|nr:Na+ dependent nucleoside transporter N-terminal domain-containing protein [Bombilactobacillus bombi]RHW48382.1 hypothetical protein DS832_02145 [Bombilactobacillus bombi]